MMTKRNINLDIVRIFAAIMVLSVHIGQYIGKDFGVGAKGVQLFFVLSGYLAFSSVQNKTVLQYYKSRLIRILPTYYFCLILIYFKDIVKAIHEGTLSEVFKGQCGIGFFRYVFFIHCFTPSNNWNMWNNHSALWTMSSFIGFYLLAPWLYKLIKNTYVGIAVLFMLLFSRNWMINAIQQMLSSYPDEAHIEYFSSMNPLTELYCFLFGAVLFIAIKESKQYLYLLILLIGMIISSLSWYSYEIVFVILVAVSVLCENMTSNIAISKIINWLSKGSFTLYLVHPLVLAVESALWYKLGIWSESLHGLVLYTSCIAVSYFIYYCIINKIERRIIK
ncbi:Peptidoglycan/LPS O-acetylase OafA/YrhL, contains acyltransferase and SGNH-hydrolase domains [Lachnospiraceae bacterium]|nr:Peptidoglycan/LPS O-acetylase OafA/YrhL, contains acyltransferase and SGNH-hydrolase domains [Lachnospiraceae bacterium]